MTPVGEPVAKSVELPTGVRLPYVEQGDPAGVPVLLLHGYADSWRSWEPLLPYLPNAIHAGHALHWEEPARFAADLVTFIEGPA